MKIMLSKEDAYKEWHDANPDRYGGAVLTYAERWAEMMEEAVADGSTLESVAYELSHRADEEGITGFMYGAAVSFLADVWIHGEELRKWHNLKTQIGHEGTEANKSGGVLNPALLVLGKK